MAKKTGKKPGVGARAKKQIEELTEELEKKETKALHVAAGAGGAIGCTLTGAFIVNRGWLDAKWTSALLSVVGAGAAYAGYHYDKPVLMWTGAGWTFAGAAHTTMAMVVDARRASEAKAKKQAAKVAKAGNPRNALPPAASERDDGHGDTDAIGNRLRLSEQRARQLELELARARQKLNPEIELAAA